MANGPEQIVPKQSAILPGYNNQPVHNNHMGIARYAGRDDSGYIMVSGRLWLWNQQLEEKIASRGRRLGQLDRAAGNVTYLGAVNVTGTGSVFQGNGNGWKISPRIGRKRSGKHNYQLPVGYQTMLVLCVRSRTQQEVMCVTYLVNKRLGGVKPARCIESRKLGQTHDLPGKELLKRLKTCDHVRTHLPQL
jgi:hypothetical protein